MGTGGRQDRWEALAEFAAEGTTYQKVYYRWLDYLNRPINAEEHVRGGEVLLLWQDLDERWVIQAQFERAAGGPRRSFADKQSAMNALAAEGFRYSRTLPAGESVSAMHRVEGASGSARMGAVVLTLAIILFVLSALIWVVWFVFRAGPPG